MLTAVDVPADYDVWRDRQALGPRTRSTYRRWVRDLVEHIARAEELKAFS